MIWLLLAPLDLLIGLLAFPLAPLIVLFTSPAGRAPWWAWPWLTFDNPIDGDAGHWERWPDDGRIERVFARRVAWLWRNRGYNASFHWFGRVLAGDLRRWGNPLVSNRPLVPGWSFERDAGGAWEFYAVVPHVKGRCLRVRLGWKIPINAPPGTRCMLVTHISPFMGYSKSTA